MRVIGFSVITDMCLPDALEAADVSKIIATAKGAEPKLRTLVSGIMDYERARLGKA
jgi:purine-nucleoside phosphorylase